MRRHVTLRIAALVFATFVAVAPAFAAPKTDSPVGTLQRIILKIKRIFVPSPAEDPSFPHP
jgi:hypothetical protein